MTETKPHAEQKTTILEQAEHIFGASVLKMELGELKKEIMEHMPWISEENSLEAALTVSDSVQARLVAEKKFM